VIEFSLAIALWLEEAVVNDPLAVEFRVVVDQIDNADAFNHAVRVTTLLAAHAFNLEGVRLINYRVIKDQVSLRGLDERFSGLLPEQSRGEFLRFQIAIDAVMV
jgi:hypothetical protein